MLLQLNLLIYKPLRAHELPEIVVGILNVNKSSLMYQYCKEYIILQLYSEGIRILMIMMMIDGDD